VDIPRVVVEEGLLEVTRQVPFGLIHQLQPLSAFEPHIRSQQFMLQESLATMLLELGIVLDLYLIKKAFPHVDTPIARDVALLLLSFWPRFLRCEGL